MQYFLQPTKLTISIYILLIIDNIHFLVGKLINVCVDPMGFCAISTSEAVWMIINIALLPIKLFTAPFYLAELILNPVIIFIILLFIYYLYASLIYYLFKNKRKIFYMFIIIIPIIVISGAIFLS